MRFELLHGDCRTMMQLFVEDGSIDSVVTDPPYELGFMGKGWDSTGIANDPKMWAEAFRALKPGGHLLAFSGTRTYHRMVCAIEDAGFEVRDQIGWLYGSGFPKSHNGEWGGTALKPAWEPICVARKPLIGTVAANWLAHGTGALNIDACRVMLADGRGREQQQQQGEYTGEGATPIVGAGVRDKVYEVALGRWPANIIHDGSDEVLAAFPQAPGQLADASSSSEGRKTQTVYGAMVRGSGGGEARQELDKSAARFFYCAKASKRDRNEGCDALALKPSGMVSNTSGQHITRRDGGAPAPTANNHPTVKPTELMRYLCRLVTPPGGKVLDPFLGSGSTGKAAMLEGFDFVGCELSAEYLEIAKARIGAVAFGDLA